ncbi:MAG TPA: hypothetical protein VFK80_02400 [Limnochordia bacterium]|nr:hypothetical protein [Limnochordia bacterium]
MLKLRSTLLGAALAASMALSVSGAAFAMDGMLMNRYGGGAYTGAPALDVTAALVKAGGGPGHFSIVDALNAMVGSDLVGQEVQKLTKQYGADDVNTWVTAFNWAVEDGLKIATAKGIALPEPAALSGQALAATLVGAGLDTDGTFWSGILFDHALSHDIHNQVMDDANKAVGAPTDLLLHRITNQAMFDLANALGKTDVKLAELH